MSDIWYPVYWRFMDIFIHPSPSGQVSTGLEIIARQKNLENIP